MNRSVVLALSCLITGVCQSTPPTNVPTIVTTLNNRLKNGIHPLQQLLIAELRSRRKAADKQERIECRQAQHGLQQKCSEEKKKIAAQCAQEQTERKQLLTQVVSDLRNAKRSSATAARTLHALLTQTDEYISILHDHARTAQLSDITRKIHEEKKWLSSLQTTLEKSGIDLTTPLRKTKKREPKKGLHQVV